MLLRVFRVWVSVQVPGSAFRVPVPASLAVLGLCFAHAWVFRMLRVVGVACVLGVCVFWVFGVFRVQGVLGSLVISIEVYL